MIGLIESRAFIFVHQPYSPVQKFVKIVDRWNNIFSMDLLKDHMATSALQDWARIPTIYAVLLHGMKRNLLSKLGG